MSDRGDLGSPNTNAAESYLLLEIDGVAHRDVAPLTTGLFACGALGLEERFRPGEAPAPVQPWERPRHTPRPNYMILSVWFDGDPIDAVDAMLRSWRDDPSAPVPRSTLSWRWEKVEDRDWDAEWRASITPFEVDGVVIAPPWDIPSDEQLENKQLIVIEPGQGFGTGQHDTTRAAIRHLLSIVRSTPPKTVETLLDVGSGSGILALVAARMGLRASGIDVEAAAVRDAQKNAQYNALEVDFSTTTLRDVSQPADIVMANLHAELLLELADELIRLTAHRLVLAGILSDRCEVVTARFDAELIREEEVHTGEWVSLVYRVAP